MAKHGFCAVCSGEISTEQGWTLTKMLNRVHYNPDYCWMQLHPKEYEKFLKANPRFVDERSQPNG